MRSFFTLLLLLLLVVSLAGSGWILANLGANVKVVYTDPGNGPTVP